MNTASPLDHFRQQYFGPVDHYLGWHDGYEADFPALDQLTPADRATAEAELCASLQADRADPRVLLGLGHLRSRAALPLLHAYMPRSGIYALQAIARIDPAALDADRVLVLLRHPKIEESDLYGLVIGLGSFFTLAALDPRLIMQLLALLAHRYYLVRTHALDALRKLYHLPAPKEGNGHTITRADIFSDELFCLISTDQRPADFRRAQERMQAQMAAGPRPA